MIRFNAYISLFLFSFSFHSFAVDMNFKGELLDSPCIIDPNNSDIDVTLRDIPALNMNYLPGKSVEMPFQIKLINCNLNQAGAISIYFNGETEEGMGNLQHKYLKVSGQNEGKIGLGVLDEQGELVTIGEGDSGYPIEINDENITVNFSAFIKSTPDALENKSVVADNYSARATFEVRYE
ncbi:hypothetical protein BS333_19185 [Vibrio azureus]|nr:fimbrial protein [Vibrio azureus]AUI88452.1 hypothetical protein BS333_19185 [Vibrio azureus]